MERKTENCLEERIEIVDFKKLRDKPEKEPIIQNKYGVKDTLVEGTDSCNAYLFLKEHADQAFTSTEIAKAINAKKTKSMANSCRTLEERRFVFRISFKIPTVGKFGGFIYSHSEKALYKRLWKETPLPIKKCLKLIWSNDTIFCLRDLLDLTGATRNQVGSWLQRIFCEKLKLIQRRRIEGLRTFYFNNNISEEKFQSLFKIYYKEEVLKEKRLSWLKGNEFEQFATWVFVEYMKLKGLNIEIHRCNKEPVDFIGRVRIDISDLLSNNKHNDIVLTQFVISCKHYRLDRPLGSWYVLGFSGCLREGRTFRGEEIFSPRNSIGIIFCTKATSYAYEMCGKLGIRIFDLHKLLRMYEVVKKLTNQEHPLFEKISLRVSAYRERRGGKVA